MDRHEEELQELLDIAERLIEEGRSPTDEERRRFQELQAHVERRDESWRTRWRDEIDRLAAALEGMGI
jgi:hypothetical protein